LLFSFQALTEKKKEKKVGEKEINLTKQNWNGWPVSRTRSNHHHRVAKLPVGLA
jgi:hypothetical protein